jgi:hypothetical protein
MRIEIWKDIPGYEGKYQISNLGRVKSLKRKNITQEFIRKLIKDKLGYYRVSLSKKNKIKTFLVHRLVAQAFLNNYSRNMDVNHKDHITNNNNISNLEMCSRKDNIRFSKKSKLKKSSQYKGVSFVKNTSKWESYITKDGIKIFLGNYVNEIDAAIAYNKAAIKIFKNFALLNEVV